MIKKVIKYEEQDSDDDEEEEEEIIVTKKKGKTGLKGYNLKQFNKQKNHIMIYYVRVN